MDVSASLPEHIGISVLPAVNQNNETFNDVHVEPAGGPTPPSMDSFSQGSHYTLPSAPPGSLDEEQAPFYLVGPSKSRVD